MKLGEKLGRKLKKGDIVALIGDLGAGKTVFTKGIARALNVRKPQYVNSPTFVTVKEYKGKIPLYHFDLYRLAHPSLIDNEAYDEYFYGDGVSVVEWADKIIDRLPPHRIEVRLKVLDEERREIIVKE